MCEVDFDGDPADVWAVTHQKARKTYRCECCGATIHPKELYAKVTAIFDGYVDREVSCAACRTDTEEFSRSPGHMDNMPSCFFEELSNCVGDVDSPWKSMYDRICARISSSREVAA
ncbi:hypothetical protein UFOVP75_203 [uncultured Caudovirales phage]|uniref:Uncharacterized protein n=1 Tax=uncultured Caudovirales phage TaxID=2100421 RepID=A0A6J5KZF9_9CAUD|nr:hypothetical protein UFOVP75_203 [uncultured Caudovirales phage]